MQPWWAKLNRSTICHNKYHDATLDDDHEYDDDDDIEFDDDVMMMYLAGFICSLCAPNQM